MPNGSVTVRNVPAYRYRHAVPVDVPGLGRVDTAISRGAATGFSSSSDHGQTLNHGRIDALTDAQLGDPRGAGGQRHHRRRTAR